jgi:hypothetical protein
MTLHPYDLSRPQHPTIFTNWECRYFSDKIPRMLLNQETEKLLGEKKETAAEDDIYLLGGDPAINIKFRKRVNTIKVKTLLERESDNFELWESTIDSRLPAAPETWRAVLTLLDARGDLSQLAVCESAADALNLLCTANPNLRWVEVWKQRTFYYSGNVRIDSAKTRVGQNVLYSTSFESPDLGLARAARFKFPIAELGEEQNYIEMLLKLQRFGKNTD